ncbi:MAG: dihydrofolate reductase family protein [Candidatus Nitrosopumilus sp. bin_68KS]
MRKIILFIASSLDGYIARNNGNVDWLPVNVSSGYDDFYKSVDTVIMGKITYDQVLTFGTYPYQDKKSYIFTQNSDQKKDDNVLFVSDVEKLVKDLISTSGKDIWLVGGSKIISTFMNLGFVDEIIITIIPVFLGNGIQLFKDIQKEIKFELVKTTGYGTLVELHYKTLK